MKTVVLMNNETEQQQRREENGNVDGPKKSDLWNFQPAQIELTEFYFSIRMPVSKLGYRSKMCPIKNSSRKNTKIKLNEKFTMVAPAPLLALSIDKMSATFIILFFLFCGGLYKSRSLLFGYDSGR